MSLGELGLTKGEILQGKQKQERELQPLDGSSTAEVSRKNDTDTPLQGTRLA